MNYQVSQLIDHLTGRPAPPQRTATKATFAKFALAYSEWSLTIEALIGDVRRAAERAEQEAARHAPANYYTDAISDAAETADNFLDEIVEALVDDGKASDDLHNDYPNGDSWHHENHVDKSYDLSDAAEVMSQLSEHTETDKGLWEGLEPEEALSAQAAYTYGAAVLSDFRELIEKINEAYDDASAVLDENDAYSDIDEAKKLRGELEAGEIAETDEHCTMQLAIVQAVIDGKDGGTARKEQIKKMVEKTIAEYQS